MGEGGTISHNAELTVGHFTGFGIAPDEVDVLAPEHTWQMVSQPTSGQNVR